MRKKTVGKSFRRINLATTMDFGDKNDKIRTWTINNGGTYSKELNDGVTHLVCSKQAWKEYPAIGKPISFTLIVYYL
jgi:twin BRCT domain